MCNQSTILYDTIDRFQRLIPPIKDGKVPGTFHFLLWISLYNKYNSYFFFCIPTIPKNFILTYIKIYEKKIKIIKHPMIEMSKPKQNSYAEDVLYGNNNTRSTYTFTVML